MAILGFIPDWMFFLAGGILIYIIYYYLPDDTKTDVRWFLANYGIYVLAILVWLYWHSKTGAIYEFPSKWPANMNRATFFVSFAIILYVLVKSWLYEFRYYTYHFVADNISGSCHRYHEIGNVGEPESNWAIFFLGGSGGSDEKFVFPWPWVKKIVVVPKSSVQFLGNQIVAFSQVDKVNIDELPEDVADYIEKDPFGRWKKEEVYFGLWDISVKAKNPKFQDIENQIKKQDNTINKLKKMLRGDMQAIREFVSGTTAVQRRLRGDEAWRQQQQQPTGGE